MNQDIKLPENFDGVFKFTNFSDEDFSTLWNSIEYTFPKESTVPMIISGESPENVQAIRRKFAHRLAEREFFKSDRYNSLNELTKKNGIPPSVDMEKEPFYIECVQKCLEPLQIGKITLKKASKSETTVSEYTKVLDQKDSLKAGTFDASTELDNLE